MDFTLEQMNLMCIFYTSSRWRLMQGIQDALPDVKEPELRIIMLEVFNRLAGMSDEAFAAIEFDPADGLEEMEE